MKKRKKNKKQKGAVTHPIGEVDRVQSIMQAGPDPEPVHKLKYNKKPRSLCVPSDIGEASDIRLDKRYTHIH